ncbi:hypothetical protein ACJZ2D_009786 [Fusarium nematophilum]
MADPYYHDLAPGHFFEFLVWVELLVQFPLALYLTRALFTGKSLSGAGELAGNVYGLVTGLCTALVCHDMWHLGVEVISPQAKQSLLFGAYLPYAVIPLFMAADMQLRLLARLRALPQIKHD